LTNIASGTSSQTRTIVNAGAIGVFVSLLTHANVDVREQAAWALGNIAGDSADHRDQVIRAGALQPLLAHAMNSESRLMMIRNCAQAVSNMARQAHKQLTRFVWIHISLNVGHWLLSSSFYVVLLLGGKPQPDFNELKSAIPVLAKLLFILDDEALSYVCWAVSFLTDDNSPTNFKIRAITQVTTIIPRLISLLSHTQTDVKVPCLRSLGNIVAGDDDHTRMVIEAGGIPALVKLLTSRKLTIRKETCWVSHEVVMDSSSGPNRTLIYSPCVCFFFVSSLGSK
jgi:importin subunit alpha-6/7